MTTIAYRDSILAFDSRISDAETHVGWANKGRITETHLMAGCGLVDDIEAAMDWIEKTGGKIASKAEFDLHEREVECEIITIDKEGKIMFYGTRLYPITLDAPYHALGSGMPYALGAMAIGATAKQAVNAAIKHDLYSGGHVRSISIDQIGAPKPKKKTTRKK